MFSPSLLLLTPLCPFLSPRLAAGSRCSNGHPQQRAGKPDPRPLPSGQSNTPLASFAATLRDALRLSWFGDVERAHHAAAFALALRGWGLASTAAAAPPARPAARRIPPSCELQRVVSAPHVPLPVAGGRGVRGGPCAKRCAPCLGRGGHEPKQQSGGTAACLAGGTTGTHGQSCVGAAAGPRGTEEDRERAAAARRRHLEAPR